ncbi:MAG: phospholipid carrier-dependent glycosyltransferase [Deltaproteobacteria bacterium]|nr:phospholipid carrier-dependent glycosyltransferase [Deltaproteobacteria bacterium]
MNKNTIPTAVSCLLLVSIAVLLFTECLMNLTPPISRDALIHHLAIPKLWIKHGGLYEIPWAKYSYYPMNIDLLYLACLYFKKDIAPKFIHLAFALGTGLLIYIHLKMRFSRNWGLLGVLIFLSTPIIIRLSTSAYVDLGLIFFTTASVLSFVQWQDGKYKQMKWFIFSAVSMGLAAGCKYNGLIPWVFVNLMLIFYFARDTQKQVSALNCGLLFFALSLVTVSPWYIKNYLFTSKPIYPLFDNIFNPSNHPGSLSKSS